MRKGGRERRERGEEGREGRGGERERKEREEREERRRDVYIFCYLQLTMVKREKRVIII
jgi:hypothetical protein